MPVAPPEAATRLAGRSPEPEHVVLLVKDGTGYANLLHLMCEVWVAAEPERAGQVTAEVKHALSNVAYEAADVA